MPDSPKTILVVEDNKADVLTIKAAFQRLNYGLDMQYVDDGQAALNYLTGKYPYEDRALHPLPHLILLDLVLPKVNGFEILEWARTHPEFRFTPVIILAGSNVFADIQRAYAFGANSFITKPSNLNKLVLDIKSAFEFWLFSSAIPIRQQQQPPASGASPSLPNAA